MGKKLYSVPCHRRRKFLLWCLGVWSSFEACPPDVWTKQQQQRHPYFLYRGVSGTEALPISIQSAWLAGLAWLTNMVISKAIATAYFGWAESWRSKAVWARMVHQQVVQAGSTNYSCSLLAPACTSHSGEVDRSYLALQAPKEFSMTQKMCVIMDSFSSILRILPVVPRLFSWEDHTAR